MADADPDIGSDEIQKYFDAHEWDPKCPCCGENNWDVVKEADGFSYTMIAISRGNPQIFDASIAFMIMLICQRCGWINSILRERVANWLRSQENG